MKKEIDLPSCVFGTATKLLYILENALWGVRKSDIPVVVDAIKWHSRYNIGPSILLLLSC